MSEEKVLVSVITACFNSVKTIEATFESIRNQTYPFIEHIVIDGGSTDGTTDIILKYQDKLAYWISESDRGLADAWNKGLKIATGKIIGLLNADDQYESQAIAKAVSALQSDESALVYGDAALFKESRNLTDSLFQGNFAPATIYHGFGFMHTTCFVTARVYHDIGVFDLRYKIAVDTDFLLRCYLANVEFRKTDLVTYMQMGGMSQEYSYKAYMEFLSQLNRYGFSKWRIALAWVGFVRHQMRLRIGKLLRKLKFILN